MSLERAEAFIRAGELDEALVALNTQLQAFPDDTDALRLRIDLLIRLRGHAGEALTALRMLPELREDDYVARFGVLLNQGVPGVEEILIEAYRQSPGVAALADLALGIFFRRGAVDQALVLLADLPKTPYWLLWSARFYALSGEDAIAAEHCCSALDQLGEPDDPLLRLQRAHFLLLRAAAYHRLSAYSEAGADYTAAASIIPDDPLIPFNRGLLAFDRGDLEDALALCRAALDCGSAALREHMGKALLDEPRYATLAQSLLS